MKVPNTRYNLLTLAATMLAVTLLVLMNLGAQGRVRRKPALRRSRKQVPLHLPPRRCTCWWGAHS